MSLEKPKPPLIASMTPADFDVIKSKIGSNYAMKLSNYIAQQGGKRYKTAYIRKCLCHNHAANDDIVRAAMELGDQIIMDTSRAIQSLSD